MKRGKLNVTHHFVSGYISNPDSVFIGWSGACTGTVVCQVTMDANKAVTATFMAYSTYMPTVWR